ncbi:MAG: HlyD family type I secretion periplasmic adaptor subunit [Hyphomicrobium zavarzinii]|uniref:HlyD family type I secretion periplasmic adaptor subunit n=1 Tax=Hyphomicrobium zavarzinii TaxID=48292 RepID=UPI001A4CAC8A|nr:HlyD family type I secretion periplasmic adaptor subunit [Hyphomicrobium zavarzinii]MBL8846359.1 HlyD family type I secretion periplasmic adaptor subunit [Hyphomicrobium zavarzinii]
MRHALAKLELLRTEYAQTIASDASAASQKGDSPAAPPAAPPAPASPHAALGADFRDAGRLINAGLLIVLGFFGFLGGWAALSSIESAAITYGVVGADGNRKAVQHMDGGIVSAILVKEGDLVSAGQELIRLDQLQPRAALEIQSAAVVTQSAVLARLEAESAGLPRINFPASLTDRRNEPAIEQLLVSQEQILEARRSANATQVGTIREQIKQARSQIDIFKAQSTAVAEQYRMIQEELGPKQMLYDKGYATNSPVLQLKRAAAALQGQQQEYQGHVTRLEHLIGQLENQIVQIERDFRVKIAQELEDARTKIADATERERVANDVLTRTVIRAPVSGHVLGLSVNTVGGVIGKGERLLEIVPAESGIVIKAQLRPSDALDVHEGMRAELRVLTAQGRKLPVVHGTVRNRSADARPDAEGHALLFDVSIDVDPVELKALGELKLTPGTPVEVIIPTGSRTVLEYMLDPVSQSMRHGLREK